MNNILSVERNQCFIEYIEPCSKVADTCQSPKCLKARRKMQ